MKRIFLGCVSLMMLFGFCCNSFAQTTQSHVVQRGETYAFIAKKYGITEDELIKANPGHKVCYVGLKLVIPVSECVVESSASSAIVPEQKAQPVKESQVLAASDYEVPTQSLAKSKKEKKKKSGKSFWKALGSIASGIGEVVVGTTDALAETGLLDKTGKVGDALGFTADVTNLTQGKVSNYMSQTRSGKSESQGEVVGTDMSLPSATQVNVDSKSVEEIDRQIAALRREDETLEKQKQITGVMKGYDYTTGMSRSEKRAELRKEVSKMGNTVTGANGRRMKVAKVNGHTGVYRAGMATRTTASRSVQGQKRQFDKELAIARRQKEIQQQIANLLARKAELLGNPDIAYEQSAFEEERSKRSRVNSDPKVTKARRKAANVYSNQKIMDVASDEIWKLENDPNYRPELSYEQRKAEIERNKKKKENARSEINY